MDENRSSQGIGEVVRALVLVIPLACLILIAPQFLEAASSHTVGL